MPYIAEGTYGCVFYPHLQCTNNTKNKDAMGKIFSDPISFKDEQEISRLIRTIDPNNTFTLPFFESCVTNLKKASNDDKLQKCSHASDILKSGLIETDQLIHRYGGVDLKNVVEHFASYRDVYIDDFIHLLIPIIKGIITLQQHNYIHCDIKPPNILYDEKSGRLYLIDFGLLTKYKDLVTESNVLKFTYPYYPPEFKIYYYMFHNFIPPLAISNKVKNNLQYYNEIKYKAFLADHCGITDSIEQVVAHVVSNATQNPPKFRKDFINDLVKKTDIYSLGITYIEMCFLLKQEGIMRVRNKLLFDEFMKTTIPSMIHYDPYLRAYPEDVLSSIQTLLKKHKTPSSPQLKMSPIVRKIATPNIPSPKSKLLPVDCMKLKRTQLIELLKARHLPISGNKKTLCDRLLLTSPKTVEMNIEQCKGMRKAPIMEKLARRKLPQTGTKEQLCRRLYNYVNPPATQNLTKDQCKQLKVAQIKEKLERQGIKKPKGKKAELCDQLMQKIS